MKKFKTWLIHFLGGKTKNECYELKKETYHFGICVTLIEIRDKMDSLYGKSADYWCKSMYKYISDKIEYNGIIEKRPTAHS